MKSCDEMVDSLLARKEQYAAQQKRKRKVLARTATALCCCCLVALLGFGLWQRIGQPAGGSSSGDTIRIQTVEEVPAATLASFDLEGDNFVRVTRDEVSEYYGTDILPTVPEDLEEEGILLGVYKQETKFTFGMNGVTSHSETHTRYVAVKADEECIPEEFWDLFDDPQTMSEIGGVEVGIAQTQNGDFYAEFLLNGVGFRIIASGLTQDEFMTALSSLLD